MSALIRTTLAFAVDARATVLRLTSATGVVKGGGLCLDREVCRVTATPGSDGAVRVTRGVNGWQTAHAALVPVTIGAINQFQITREAVLFNPSAGLCPQASWIDTFGTTPSLTVSVRAQESDQALSVVAPVATD